MMKRFLLLFTLLIFTTSCEDINMETGTSQETTQQIGDFHVLVIDSCEYLSYSYRDGYSYGVNLAHKGNCKFCEQRKCDN